jgi:cytochrome c553
MNISTGGPHILLFERDQQLTALIISEFQLAGYECHTARTAVEVFDALARYPVRMVLVDLAQAAAARREFWVALDTQRRGRGINVLTFHCSNIAGYGPHDPEERSQNTAADLDIDGMLGIMKLVDEVRNRVPGAGSITNTIPRVPRVAPTPQPVPVNTAQRTGSLAPVSTNNGNAFRVPSGTDNTGNLTRNASGVYPQQATGTQTAPSSVGRAGSGVTNNPTSTKSVSYTDKIRAVLYPNQRNWSTQGNTGSIPAQTIQEQPRAETAVNNNQSSPTFANNSTVLQRLANGQASTDNTGESGLAQLSRLAHANYQTAPSVPYENNRDNYQQQISYQTAPSVPYENNRDNYQQQASAQQVPIQYENSRDNYQQQANSQPTRDTRFTQSSVAREQTPVNMGAIDYALPPTVPPEGTIGAQPLRASPIQDIPIDRPGSNPANEGSRRPDVLARINHGQQQTMASSPSPLASIATPTVQASGTMSAPSTAPIAAESPAYTSDPVEDERNGTNDQPEMSSQTIEKLNDSELEDFGAMFVEQAETKSHNNGGQVGEDADMAQNRNTMLFDIMQSLPPMPPVTAQSQTMQPQVLSGRATRSLGSVLLAGHLVPQNRLEVAQNIQRMLRGVDLNYQLGEILLMFKLLTPDQLLAASLVSYGMITTTQVSALGRIRQELHSIGLEYDLESLLILFRILTPEQLREAKSGMQG